MYQNKIAAILKNDQFTKSVFQGIYPVDLLPKTVKQFPAAFVANTDESIEDGEHSVAFYFPNDKEGGFFYSYGNSAHTLDQRFVQFMIRICRGYQSFTYNCKRLQGPVSNVCGHYCIYYIAHRARGYTGTSTIEHLGPDSLYSDFIVKNFCKNLNVQ